MLSTSNPFSIKFSPKSLLTSSKIQYFTRQTILKQISKSSVQHWIWPVSSLFTKYRYRNQSDRSLFDVAFFDSFWSIIYKHCQNRRNQNWSKQKSQIDGAIIFLCKKLKKTKEYDSGVINEICRQYKIHKTSTFKKLYKN